jgi:hypothetical protein
MAAVRAPESEMPEFVTTSSVEGAAVAPRDWSAFPDEGSRREATPDRDDQNRNHGIAR